MTPPPGAAFHRHPSHRIGQRIVDLHDEKRALAGSILAKDGGAALRSTEDPARLIRGDPH